MKKNQATGGSNSRLEPLKRLLHPFSRGRSRASSRSTSPVPGNATVDDVPSTATTSVSTLVVRSDDKPDNKLDEVQDAEQEATVKSQDQEIENSDPDAADLTRDYDAWKIAEVQLRRDEKNRKLLDAYYDILKSKLTEGLEPAGTPERRKQISTFIESESEKFQNTNSLGTIGQVLNRASNLIVASKNVVVAASAPCLPASIACAGIMLILSLSLQAESQRGFLHKGLGYIPGLIYRLAKIEKLYLNHDQQTAEQGSQIETKEAFKSSLITLCAQVIEFQAHGVCHLQKRAAIRALSNMTKQDEWDSMLAEIEKSEETVMKFATVEGLEDVWSIRQTSKASKMAYDKSKLEQQAAARGEKIAAFLKSIHEHAWPHGDGYEASKKRVRQPVKGTCKWLTGHAKFRAWDSLNDPKSTSLLLLTAYPGCGKSVLSRHLIDTVLVEPNRTVCYFFFKDDFEHQKSPIKALCTLLHQLLDMCESNGCTLPADSALRRLETMGDESFFGSVSSLWKTFTEASLLSNAGEIVCVLDALDECRPKDRNELIEAINDFYQSPRNKAPCLKFFLTSRPYGEIQSQFSSVWRQQLSEIRLAGEEDDVAGDIAKEIEIVVNDRIDNICDTFNLPDQKRKLMKSNLGAAPGRTYLWITLVFDDLLGNTSIPNKNYINKKRISKEYIESFVKHPPANVDGAYERILNRATTEGADQDLKKTRTILQMVLAARRPLTLREMSIALPLTEHQPPYEDLADEMETEEGTWDTIRDCCGLLVIRVDNALYLLHQTVREFLVAPSSNASNEGQKAQDTTQAGKMAPLSPYGWKHSFDLVNANSVLAEACVSYIHSNFPQTEDSLLRYSATFWIDHYHQSEESCQTALTQMTRDLCLQTEPYTQWTNSYNIHETGRSIPTTGSPLCLSSALGLDRAVEIFLFDLGLNIENEVNSMDFVHGQTPLSWAAENGREAVVRLLLRTGRVDADSKDYGGRTPLWWAAGKGHESVVQLLLDTGMVNVDLKDNYGQTPLSYAAEGGNEAVVRLLLGTGKVDVDSKDDNDQTPLSFAAERGNESVVQLLLSTGKVDADSNDTSGRTPLSWAIDGGHKAVVELLQSFTPLDST